MLRLWRKEFDSLGGPLGIRPQHQISDAVWSARYPQYNTGSLNITAWSDAR